MITAKSFSNNAKRIHRYLGRVLETGPRPLPAEFFFVSGGGCTFGRVILLVNVLLTDAALVALLSPLYHKKWTLIEITRGVKITDTFLSKL